MTSEKRICILHLHGTDSSGMNVKPFNEHLWARVKECDRRRHELYKFSKYFLTLPESYDDTMGYHSQCFSNFTSIIQVATERSDSEHVLRSSTPDLASSSSTGIFKNKCLFCLKTIKKTKGKKEHLGLCETGTAEMNIKHAATVLKDEKMLGQITCIDMRAKQVKYHHTCRRKYLHDAEAAQMNILGKDMSLKMKEHNDAFTKLKDYINRTLIDNEGSEFLTSIHERYVKDLHEDSTYRASSLCDKIMKEYPNQLKKLKQSDRTGIIIYSSKISPEVAIKLAQFDHASVQAVALYLRSLILKMQKNTESFPQPVTLESLTSGQGNPPTEVLDFFRVLYTGSKVKNENNDRTERLIRSVSDDVVFATSRGNIKTSKHLLLGLSLKSLTGSRKLLEIINHLGHCVSYHIAENIETDLATSISEKQQSTPEGILRQSGLATGLAWDNYDELNETLSGSNTLHDTVGICYQNIPKITLDSDGNIQLLNPTTSISCETSATSDQSKKVKSRRKRAFSMTETNLQPYRKKPKIEKFLYEVREFPKPSHVAVIENRDVLWMILNTLGKVPMWAGWNAQVTNDELPLQKVCYMDNLNLPPTRLDVVAETLRISQRVAAECGETYAVVHYDLAVAKPAMQIQATEAPLYDNVFICFGPFHIEMAFFASIGYILEASGGPHILMDADVLASGSLNGFLQGKHYNRCKRLHPLLATAFNILHFKAYLKHSGPIPDALMATLKELIKDPTNELLENLEATDAYQGFMTSYQDYRKTTMDGQHGATAKFWMIYIYLVEIFLRFNRSVRTNDFDMFTYTLRQICPIFFTTNRPNYARWMTKYLLNLVNIDITHPGLRQVFQNGALSVRRTKKTFSRTSVDITLEQTVNADAASRSTGISAFNQSYPARRRWMITRSIRSAIVGHLLTMCGMKANEDISKSLKPSRVTKDNTDLQKLIHVIERTMNPFDLGNDNNLYCLSTGIKVHDDIRNDLLECLDKGEEWHLKFLDECFKDSKRFEKPIPRRKIKNFASSAIVSKLKVKEKTIIELKGTRDLFGRLLYLSSQANIDLSVVFSHPLAPVPPALAHLDGSLHKTDKSKLMHKLETLTNNEPPVETDIVIVDAMFFIHTLHDPPNTYGKLAEEILQKLCSLAPKVHFVCDVYKSPSLKEEERNRRGDTDVTYAITGPEQKRPKDWQRTLRSPRFKEALFTFLSQEWTCNYNTKYLENCNLCFGFGSICYSYSTKEKTVLREKIEKLTCQHEEADTRMAFHLYYITDTSPNASVIIRTNDTDVLVIIAYHVRQMEPRPAVWLDVGLCSSNTRRFINVSKLAENDITECLPGLHSYTGCDVTAAFMSKGKIKPTELIMKSKCFQNIFSILGKTLDINQSLQVDLEKFVCALYGKPHMDNVNDVRYSIFQHQYSPTNLNKPLEKLKGLNSSTLPPCKSVLINKALRCNYVAYIWRNAHLANPYVSPPECHGWKLEGNKYLVNWFDCEQVPRNVISVLETNPLQQDEEDVDFELTAMICESDVSDDEWE